MKLKKLKICNNNKGKLAILCSFVVVTIIFVVILYYGNKSKSESNISLMLETKANSGEYKLSSSTKWPSSGYTYNEELSYCENGSTLVWNEETNSVKLKNGLTDKCYVYFDVVPLTFHVAVAGSNLPTTYGKLGSVSCTNGTATYNQRYNRIEVSQISDEYTSCTLDYTESSDKQNLATYITGLSGTTQGTGQVVNENGYRYEGKNPNNYVWFNNEYWRIIGVFDSASHGVSGQNLVKIIRAETLGGLAWDKSGESDWTASSLKSLLNGAYYNAQDGTSSGYCYGSGATVTGNCDYTKKGIQSTYRSMIANVTWYLGGYSTTYATAAAFYGYERGTTVYTGRPTSTTGYIGLMYPSDYGYSVLSSSCARTEILRFYDDSTCAGASWLYGKGHEWTLSSYSSDSLFVSILSGAHLDDTAADCGYGVRPVLYLNSSVYKIDGSGTLDNPYIIGM